MRENSKVFSSAESTMGDMGNMIKQIMEIVTAAHSNIQEINLANNEKNVDVQSLENMELSVVYPIHS